MRFHLATSTAGLAALTLVLCATLGPGQATAQFCVIPFEPANPGSPQSPDPLGTCPQCNLGSGPTGPGGCRDCQASPGGPDDAWGSSSGSADGSSAGGAAGSGSGSPPSLARTGVHQESETDL